MLRFYEAVMTPEDGGLGVEIPDLGVATWGADMNEAVAMAYDLMVNVCAAVLDFGEELPATTWGHPCPVNGTVVVICGDISADMPEDGWMEVADAASILGVTSTRVRAMARSGVLRARKVGGMWQIATESVRERQANPPRGGRPAKKKADALQA